MAWEKGLSRQEQLKRFRSVASERVDLARAVIAAGDSEGEARKVIRLEFGVSAMTAYRDVRVAKGGKRGEGRSPTIKRGWPTKPSQEAFTRGIDSRPEDEELLAMKDSTAVLVATRQLLSGSGAAFRFLLCDEEAGIGLSKHWLSKKREADVLSDASAFHDNDSKAGRQRTGKALDRYLSVKRRTDSRWR